MGYRSRGIHPPGLRGLTESSSPEGLNSGVLLAEWVVAAIESLRPRQVSLCRSGERRDGARVPTAARKPGPVVARLAPARKG